MRREEEQNYSICQITYYLLLQDEDLKDISELTSDISFWLQESLITNFMLHVQDFTYDIISPGAMNTA
jgi:hypothetical protein